MLTPPIVHPGYTGVIEKRCRYCHRTVPTDWYAACPGCAAHDYEAVFSAGEEWLDITAFGDRCHSFLNARTGEVKHADA